MAKQKPSIDKAQTKDKWRGFGAGEYSLNTEVIHKIPISEVSEAGEGGVRTTSPTTVGEAFKFFNGWLRKEGKEYVEVKGEPIRDIQFPYDGFTVETASGEKRFSGTDFAEHLLYVLLNLRKEGINPYKARWFFYDRDSSRDASESHTFFLVCDGKIVQEKIDLFRYIYDNDFEPAVLHDPLEGLESIWHDDYYWQEAETRFWYRKFYTETKTGQLVLLRPDEPELFFYPKAPSLTEAQPHINWFGLGLTAMAGAGCIYFLSRSIWGGVLGLIFLLLAGLVPGQLVGELIYEIRNGAYRLRQGSVETTREGPQHNSEEVAASIAQNLGWIRDSLGRLEEMAEFSGEQTVPNFAEAVKSFKDAQREEQRRQAGREAEEKRFNESLDAAVRDAVAERHRQAEAAREVRRSAPGNGASEPPAQGMDRDLREWDQLLAGIRRLSTTLPNPRQVDPPSPPPKAKDKP